MKIRSYLVAVLACSTLIVACKKDDEKPEEEEGTSCAIDNSNCTFSSHTVNGVTRAYDYEYNSSNNIIKISREGKLVLTADYSIPGQVFSANYNDGILASTVVSYISSDRLLEKEHAYIPDSSIRTEFYFKHDASKRLTEYTRRSSRKIDNFATSHAIDSIVFVWEDDNIVAQNVYLNGNHIIKTDYYFDVDIPGRQFALGALGSYVSSVMYTKSQEVVLSKNLYTRYRTYDFRRSMVVDSATIVPVVDAGGKLINYEFNRDYYTNSLEWKHETRSSTFKYQCI